MMKLENVKCDWCSGLTGEAIRESTLCSYHRARYELSEQYRYESMMEDRAVERAAWGDARY